jgi:cytochrome bd ubiquinol oxidase subunit II
MIAADGILCIIGAGLIAYTVLGGADFGGGVWDLFARGPRREQQRDLIASTMGPVWEANHVWLVFVLIGLFSGFPTAFGQLTRMLAVPLAIALLGIVLRGSAFVFRQYGSAAPGPPAQPPVRGTATWGRIFAIASTVTPVMLGLCAGAIATGRLTGLFPPVAGALAIAFCAYLAAVFLCQEARSRGLPRLADDFRRRGVAAAVVAGALAVLAVPVLAHDAPDLAARLTDRATLFVVASAAGGLGSIVALLRRRFVPARVAAAVAVASVVAGWGVATYPVIMPPGLTVAQAAAPAQTLPVTLGVLIAGFAVTVPSLMLLFHIFSQPVTGTPRNGR